MNNRLLCMEIFKKHKRIKKRSIFCSYIWHFNKSKYVYWFDIHSVKISENICNRQTFFTFVWLVFIYGPFGSRTFSSGSQKDSESNFTDKAFPSKQSNTSLLNVVMMWLLWGLFKNLSKFKFKFTFFPYFCLFSSTHLFMMFIILLT